MANEPEEDPGPTATDKTQDDRLTALEDGQTKTVKKEDQKTVDDAQDRRFKDQVSDQATKDFLQDQAIKQSADILKSFVDTGPPSVDGSKGANQRLRIWVPTPGDLGTSLSMGKEFPNTSFQGFGVGTSGHIVMEGKAEDSKITIQAPGEVFVHSSNAPLYLVSQGPAVLASATSANLLSTEAVTIAAGWPREPTKKAVSGPSPPQEDHTEYTERMSAISKQWGEWDTTMAYLGMVKTGICDGLLGKGLDRLWGGIGVVAGYLDAAADPSVVIHAPKAFVIGSEQFGAVYARIGVDVVGTFAGLIGAKDAEVFGGHNASIMGGINASLSAGHEVTVAGWETEVAARSGLLKLLGGAVQIGKPTSDHLQSATKVVAIEAATAIGLSVPDPFPAGMDGSPAVEPGIHLVSHKPITQRSEKHVAVSAAEKVMVWAGAKGAEGAADDPKITVNKQLERIDLEAQSAAVEITHRGGIKLEYAGATVLLTKTQITIGFGRQNLVITSAGALEYGSKAIWVKP